MEHPLQSGREDPEKYPKLPVLPDGLTGTGFYFISFAITAPALRTQRLKKQKNDLINVSPLLLLPAQPPYL